MCVYVLYGHTVFVLFYDMYTLCVYISVYNIPMGHTHIVSVTASEVQLWLYSDEGVYIKLWMYVI